MSKTKVQQYLDQVSLLFSIMETRGLMDQRGILPVKIPAYICEKVEVGLSKGCPCAAREKLAIAAQTAETNEKNLRGSEQSLKAMIDSAKKAGRPDLAAKFEKELAGVSEKRKQNLRDMDSVDSMHSDYALKHKPGDDPFEQKAHAEFLRKYDEKLQKRLSQEQESDTPDSEFLDKMNRRLSRLTSAKEASKQWFEKNDPSWIAATNKAQELDKKSKETKGKDAQKASQKEADAKIKEIVSQEQKTAEAQAVTAPQTQPSVSPPTTQETQRKEEAPTGETQEKPTRQETSQQKAVRVASEAEPGTIWKSKKGFGAKNMRGEVGKGKLGVDYFETEQQAKLYAKTGEGTPPSRTKTPERKPRKDKGTSTKEKTQNTINAGDFAAELIGNRLKNLTETYGDSGLGKWFRQSADGTPGWDRYNSKGERIGKCGDADEGEAYAACLSPEKAQKLGKEGIASFVRRKRSAQRKAGMGKKGEGEAGGGAEPVRVSTGVDKVDEEWSKKYKDSINCENPKGFSQRAHCQGREKNMQEGKEVSIEEMKQAIEDLIALIKKHEKFAYDAKKAGDKVEYKKHRNHVAEFSADIKTVQDMIKRALRDNRTGLVITEEDGEGKPLNKPFRTPGEKKKFAVYTKNDNGNIVKVRFGDPNMSIKRDDPERLKAFRSRHSCDDDVGPKWKARYWSCQMWRSDKSVNDILGEGTENEPTNPELWEKVQDLVAGRISSMEHGGETITGPNDGKGFDVHPSAYSNAWASKLYKRLGGGWRKKETVKEALDLAVKTIVENSLSKFAEREPLEEELEEEIYEMDLSHLTDFQFEHLVEELLDMGVSLHEEEDGTLFIEQDENLNEETDTLMERIFRTIKIRGGKVKRGKSAGRKGYRLTKKGIKKIPAAVVRKKALKLKKAARRLKGKRAAISRKTKRSKRIGKRFKKRRM